jgi:hypothetical protein
MPRQAQSPLHLVLYNGHFCPRLEEESREHHNDRVLCQNPRTRQLDFSSSRKQVFSIASACTMTQQDLVDKLRLTKAFVDSYRIAHKDVLQRGGLGAALLVLHTDKGLLFPVPLTLPSYPKVISLSQDLDWGELWVHVSVELLIITNTKECFRRTT